MKWNNDETFKDLPWDNDFRIIAVPCSEDCEGKHFDKMRDDIDKDILDIFCGLLGPMDEDAPGFDLAVDLGEWDWTVWCDMSDCDNIMCKISVKYPEFAFAVFFEPMMYWGNNEEEKREYDVAWESGGWKREYFRGKVYKCKSAYVAEDDMFNYDFENVDFAFRTE